MQNKFLRISLLAIIACVLSVPVAYAHCGQCGVGGNDTHAKSCPPGCDKPCCAEKAQKMCKPGCDKPCCAKLDKVCDKSQKCDKSKKCDWKKKHCKTKCVKKYEKVHGQNFVPGNR